MVAAYGANLIWLRVILTGLGLVSWNLGLKLINFGEWIDTDIDCSDAINTAVTTLKSIYDGEDMYIVSDVCNAFIIVTDIFA